MSQCHSTTPVLAGGGKADPGNLCSQLCRSGGDGGGEGKVLSEERWRFDRLALA